MPSAMDDITFDESQEYRTCSGCFGQAYLKADVDRIGEQTKCSYCDTEGKIIAIEELADYVGKAFEDHHLTAGVKVNLL